MALMAYGPRWRTHRKLFHDFINSSTVENYDVNQIKVVSNFLVNLQRNPEAFRGHINLYISSLYYAYLFNLRCNTQAHRLSGTLDCVRNPGRHSRQRVLPYA